MRYTLKDIKILRKDKRWPSGFHYVCETISDKPYEFFMDEEEHDAIKAIDKMNVTVKVAKVFADVLERFGSFKYSEGGFDEM